ncbi:MAG: FadR/GntR family transcriptional regulator [Erysipelotrichaceae bacterium]|nr:FadR/GntR family transcriptional regulator [Erysipelotrichaceae bacterium]MDY2959033.1 FadR/GntR family transcriptional regulator [Floccifex sp.]
MEQSARDIALNYFLEEIKENNLKPGDKILNERQLSENLGISRVPLREAITILSTLGILEVRQGSGTYVSNKDSHILSTIITKYGFCDRFMVDEVFEARSLLEADGAKLAARNRTKSDLENLHDVLNQHEQATKQYYAHQISEEEMMDYDGKVHLSIAASSHNNFLVQIIEAIRSVTMEQHYFSKENTRDSQHFLKSCEFHKNIVLAIEQQDEQKAYEMMQAHIYQVENALDIESIRRKK